VSDPTFDPRLYAGILRRCPDAVIFADREGVIRLRDFSSIHAVRHHSARISLEFSIPLLHGDDGAPIGFAPVRRDATEPRWRDRELQHRLAALEEKQTAEIYR
jgi:hypothetical protein